MSSMDSMDSDYHFDSDSDNYSDEMETMSLRDSPATKFEREEFARIRAEQERDYLESLALDRKKKEEKERQLRAAHEKEEAEKRAKEEKEECRRIFEEKREELKALLCGEVPVEGEAVRVLIRFPAGDKVERRFDVYESVESLFNAALSHPSCPSLFSLNISYPRRALPIAPMWYSEWRTRAYPGEYEDVVEEGCERTFRDENLTSSVVIMVQNEAA